MTTKIPKDIVRFNVGGRIFETTSTTLSNADRNSFFGGLFDDNWNLKQPPNDPTFNSQFFVDRNPDCFGILLDLLRTGDIHISPHVPEQLLYREASFYGLLEHVRSAKWGPFDGNRLHHVRSITGRAPMVGTAIRAGPDGGCCLAHGSMVHVYDWMMQERPLINLDYQRVNDAAWIDSEHVIISACERLGGGDGGMGLFSKSNGELRHKFHVCHENQSKSFTAGALSTSDHWIFSSCKGRSNECGIGVWDQVTGQQIDFFYDSLGRSLGDADKLQWLNGSSCLLVATLLPRKNTLCPMKDNCYISLLDFREKSMVWSWSDTGTPDERRVCDAIALEDTNAICVVNRYEDLGFMDMRMNRECVRWRSRASRIAGKIAVCYPKLALHEGQLFSSKNDCLSVLCGPDWVITSRLRCSNGGSICDFSIGGDRLFALHSEESVFDIWETSTPPIL